MNKQSNSVIEQLKAKEQIFLQQESHFEQLQAASRHTPPTISNDMERLHLLHSLHIVDSPKNDTLDHIASLATAIFDCKAAGVCLIDKHRAHIKTSAGVHFDDTARNNAFCAHVIAARTSICVPYFPHDRELKEHPFACNSAFVFYAGSPIMHCNQALGTIFVCHNEAKYDITPVKLKMLEDISVLVVREIESVAKTYIMEQERRLHEAVVTLMSSSICSEQELRSQALLLVAEQLSTSHVFIFEGTCIFALDPEEATVPVLPSSIRSMCAGMNQPLCIDDLGNANISVHESWNMFHSVAISCCTGVNLVVFFSTPHIWNTNEKWFLSTISTYVAKKCESIRKHQASKSTRRKLETLLQELMPTCLLPRLIEEHNIADKYENVSIVFIDIVNFTELTAK